MKRIIITLSAIWIVLGGSQLLGQSYIVLFKQAEITISSLGHEGFQNLLKSSNHKNLTQLEEWLARRGLSPRSGLGDLWMVRGAKLDLAPDQAKQLEKESWVEGVYLDQRRRFLDPVPHSALRVGEDPPTDLWGLKRIGLEKIRAEFPQLDGTGVRVGILDTGIQSRHPEFRRGEQGSKGKFLEVTFKDFVNGIPSPYDDHGHGTHVAGTIAGAQVGIAPQVSLVVAKVFTATGSGLDSELLAAMQWVFDPDGDPATDDYAQIVSNSWGATLMGGGVHDISQYTPYRLAIQSWIHGGVIPVFAAGNSGTTPNSIPGGLPEPLAVGAIDSNSALAPFSSRGPNLWKVGSWILTILKPDVAAPGVDIESAFPGNKYAMMSGTSMATPHVSGALSLLLQANHKLKFEGVKNLLLLSCEANVGVEYGYGIMDAYQLLTLVGKKND